MPGLYIPVRPLSLKCGKKDKKSYSVCSISVLFAITSDCALSAAKVKERNTIALAAAAVTLVDPAPQAKL